MLNIFGIVVFVGMGIIVGILFNQMWNEEKAEKESQGIEIELLDGTRFNIVQKEEPEKVLDYCEDLAYSNVNPTRKGDHLDELLWILEDDFVDCNIDKLSLDTYQILQGMFTALELLSTEERERLLMLIDEGIGIATDDAWRSDALNEIFDLSDGFITYPALEESK